MKDEFSHVLQNYVTRAGLSLRHMSSLSGIPHQTLFNWLKGRQPRWHEALPGDLRKLGMALNLSRDDLALLLQLAGCTVNNTELLLLQEMSMNSEYRIPKGWYMGGEAGKVPPHYVMGVDPELRYEGKPCVTIKGLEGAESFGVLAQQIKADAYHGKRLRFSAMVKSEALENLAALFMRVGGTQGELLAFDNMRDRPITGTQDWTRHAIVLDVDESAVDITYGMFSSLTGQAWMADVQVEVVTSDVASTDILDEVHAYFPVNLDFVD